MDFIKIPQDIFKSPLGVIGAFIFLVYGVASLVFGVTSPNLDFCLQTILVIFIVIYPCIILWVFFVLVTVHSDNLYSPNDFQTSEAFLAYKAGVAGSASSQQATIIDYVSNGTAPAVAEAAATETAQGSEPVDAQVDNEETVFAADDNASAPEPKSPESDGPFFFRAQKAYPANAAPSAPIDYKSWVLILGKEALAVSVLLAKYRTEFGKSNVSEMKVPGCDIYISKPYESVFVDVKLVSGSSDLTTVIDRATRTYQNNEKFFRAIARPEQALVHSMVFVIDAEDPIVLGNTRMKIYDAATNARYPFDFTIHNLNELVPASHLTT